MYSSYLLTEDVTIWSYWSYWFWSYWFYCVLLVLFWFAQNIMIPCAKLWWLFDWIYLHLQWADGSSDRRSACNDRAQRKWHHDQWCLQWHQKSRYLNINAPYICYMSNMLSFVDFGNWHLRKCTVDICFPWSMNCKSKIAKCQSNGLSVWLKQIHSFR